MVQPLHLKGFKSIKVNRERVINDLSFRLFRNSFILVDTDNDKKVFFICNRDYDAPVLHDYQLLAKYRIAGHKVFTCRNVRHSSLKKKVIKVEFL